MTFKVNRALLKKALEQEQVALQTAHKQAEAKFEKDNAAYQSVLTTDIEKILAKAKQGKLRFNGQSAYNGKVRLDITAAPIKPKPDCRIKDIAELLKLLALSTDETFNLNEKSKFYQYACKL